MSTQLFRPVIRRVRLPEATFIIELRPPDLVGIRVPPNDFTRYTTFTALFYRLLLPKLEPRLCRLVERQRYAPARVKELKTELSWETNARVFDGGDRYLVVVLCPPDCIGLRTNRRTKASTRWIRARQLHKLLGDGPVST